MKKSALKVGGSTFRMGPVKKSEELHGEPIVLDLQKISFSGISTYLRCAKQFEWRYIKGIKSPPAIAMTEGSAHHDALEYNNNHKIKNGRDLKDSVVTEKFVDSLRQRVEKEQVAYEDESESAIIERGGIWHKKYMRDFAPKLEPVSAEKEHMKEIDLGGRLVRFHAFTDLVVPNKIIDYKTTSAYGFNNKKREIDNDLQLTFYSWLEKLRKVGQICFIKGNVPDVRELESTRNVKQVAWALRIAEEVVKAIDAGAFPMCPPTAWNCSQRFCGYYSRCAGKVLS